MKTASLFLLLLVISVASSAAVESMGIKNDVAEDSDIGRMLGYNIMNARKSSRKYWRGVYNDLLQGFEETHS